MKKLIVLCILATILLSCATQSAPTPTLPTRYEAVKFPPAEERDATLVPVPLGHLKNATIVAAAYEEILFIANAQSVDIAAMSRERVLAYYERENLKRYILYGSVGGLFFGTVLGIIIGGAFVW
jgi:hypothetical protein